MSSAIVKKGSPAVASGAPCLEMSGLRVRDDRLDVEPMLRSIGAAL
jgi:hypothetical protein